MKATQDDKLWITGAGWTYPTFGPSALPDKKMLDEIVADRPVYLVAFDGHSSWANSKALAMAGIKRDTPDPPNGTIVREGLLTMVGGKVVYQSPTWTAATMSPTATHTKEL